MKKKGLLTLCIAASMSLSFSLLSFAGEWKKDDIGGGGKLAPAHILQIVGAGSMGIRTGFKNAIILTSLAIY